MLPKKVVYSRKLQNSRMWPQIYTNPKCDVKVTVIVRNFIPILRYEESDNNMSLTTFQHVFNGAYDMINKNNEPPLHDAFTKLKCGSVIKIIKGKWICNY